MEDRAVHYARYDVKGRKYIKTGNMNKVIEKRLQKRYFRGFRLFWLQ